MRADTLALLLGAANTRAGITSIVVDHVGGTCIALLFLFLPRHIHTYTLPYPPSVYLCLCEGVLGAAVAERQGGYGRVLCAYDGSSPNGSNAAVSEAARKMGMPSSALESIYHFPLTAVGDATRQIMANNGFFPSPSSSSPSSTTSVSLLTLIAPSNASGTSTSQTSNSNNDSDLRASTSSSTSVVSTSSQSMGWLLAGADSLLIATKYSVEHTIIAMLPLLAASSPFAVYSQYIEPLLITGQRLRSEGLATHIQVYLRIVLLDCS
jgi:hypothetical protein